MSRSAAQRVADILEGIERSQRYLEALTSGDEQLAEMAEDAIERNLQIIGEAANRLPPEIVDAHPEVAWAQIRGFRNILVHQYFGIDRDIVTDVVTEYLPSLATSLRSHVAEEGRSSD
ncbi:MULTISPECIES: HepT-like ribonuclease domain-containing protein [Brevibacterium]|uniref:HepT-like ribonuclease domain-containing protein n=1 Tax=Brevibacterium TaxID=1696 RepID=UPI0031DF07FD